MYSSMMMARGLIRTSKEILNESIPKNPNNFAFWFYLIIFAGSLICSGFIFLQFLLQQPLRSKTHYQIILAVLLSSFIQVITELPFVLFHFRYEAVWIPTDLFCTIWCYIDYIFNVIILMLITFASIQRYLLVFHNNLVRRHLFLLHYFPIIFCFFYPSSFYFGFILFYPCVQFFDYTKITCQGPCYLFERIPGTLDLFINLVFPLTICVCTNCILLFRILHQKHRMKQQNKWKKNRSLVIQIISIVFVHNLIWLPIVVCLLINLFSPVPQQFFIDLSVNLFTYSIYMVIMICPFISLFTLADLRKQLIPERFLSDRIRRLIYPSTGSRGGEAVAARQPMTQTRLDSNQRVGQTAIGRTTSRVIKTDSKI